MRDGNNITHDGTGDIVFGVKDKTKTDESDIELLKTYFDKVGIAYKIPDDMLHAYWLKYMLNVSSNQSSAILRLTFGQMQDSEKFQTMLKKLCKKFNKLRKQKGLKIPR